MGWIREVVREWLARRALQGGAPVGRWAARVLCWRLRWLERGQGRGWPRWLFMSYEDSDFHTLLAVTAIMAEARDAGASRVARRTMEKLSTTQAFVAEALTVYTANYLKVTPALVGYLLAPLPETAACPYRPRVRLVGYLSAADTPWQARMRAKLAYEIVRAEDDGVAELLSTTDQPLLLQALESAFQQRVSRHDLWLDDQWLPRILRANPHLPISDRTVLLAALKGLDIPVPATNAYEAVNALLDGVRQSNAPTEFTERCRHALRTLEPGPAREALCNIAAAGDAEAEAAAIEAGFASKQDINNIAARYRRTPSDPAPPWKAGGYHTNPGGIHT